MSTLADYHGEQLPKCDFCDKRAKYDFRTVYGPWAYGCETHYLQNRANPTLGTGKGQKLQLVRSL